MAKQRLKRTDCDALLLSRVKAIASIQEKSLIKAVDEALAIWIDNQPIKITEER